ncbi:MAG: O-antigen ligase family protein [Puniceicoccales bacterium]|jgi:hypothetical protein|nr:O-antigen ligase family protein [Puniceicoccales bacterium]
MPSTFSSRVNRLYYFLTYRCHIPLAAGHYYDILVLGILTGMCLLLCAWQGGTGATSQIWAARFVAIGIGVHVLTLVTRGRTGINLRREPLVFLPWLVWCLFDWFFFSPEPWLAELSLISNCLVFIVFLLAFYHFRVPLLKWIVGGVVATFITIVTAVSLGTGERVFAWLFAGREVVPLQATFGSPAGAGAVLLMVFFPCLVVALGYRWHYWQRMLAVPACVILAMGIFATAHIGVMIGFFVGFVLVSLLVAERKRARIALVLTGALFFFCFLGAARRDVGVWRSEGGGVQDKAVLAETAWQAAMDAPVQGQGTGGFAFAFEKERPAGWNSAPRTPGSLPLTLFAEHGFLGALLLIAPVLWIWFSSLATCLATPRHEHWEKPVLMHKHRGGYTTVSVVPTPMPDTRFFLGGALAGSAAAGVVLVFDYPGPMPAVACVFALLGAAMLRNTRMRHFTLILTPSMSMVSMWLMVLPPTFWLIWVLAPLEAARDCAIAAHKLVPVLPSVNFTGVPRLTGSDAVGRINSAADESFSALSANPSNGDAWQLHALAALCLHRIYPDRNVHFATTALHASEKAVELAPKNFEFQLTRAAALQTLSRYNEAERALETALTLAPWSLSATLSYVNALSADGNPNALSRARVLLNRAKTRYPHNPRIHALLPLFQLGTSAATADGGDTRSAPVNNATQNHLPPLP